MPSRSFAALLAFLALALVFSGPAPASSPEVTQTLEVTGTSKIFNDNVPNARNHAIIDARDAAVARVASAMLPTSVREEHFSQLCRVVFNKSDRFVQNYRILAEFQEGKQLRALVEVTVFGGAVRRALEHEGLLSQRKSLPGILYLISSTRADGGPAPWWEPAEASQAPGVLVVSQKLAQKGFATIDSTSAAMELSQDPAFDRTGQDPAPMALAAQNAGAQVLVWGQARARPSSNVMGTSLKSYMADVNLKAFDAADASLIASAAGKATAVAANDEDGLAQAAQKAAEQAARDLADQIAGAWAGRTAGGGSIRMRVTGIKPLANLVTFRNVLKKEIQGVEAVTPETLTDEESVMLITYEGDGHALAQELIQHQFQRFGITIHTVAPAVMELELVPKR